MKKIILFFQVLVFFLVLSGCVINKLDDSHRIIILKETGAGNNLVIEVEAGNQWSSRMQAGPVIFNVLPQAVFWLEDSEGRLVETLYITGADFRKMRHAAKNNDGATFFTEALPYWSSKLEAAGRALPTKKNPYPDTVTSATPMSDFTLNTVVDENINKMRIFAEINKSDDVNTVYSNDVNGWAGQPSLIYSAELSALKPGNSVSLKLIGHGGMLGDEPDIYSDLSGIDTALKQVTVINAGLKK